VVPSIKFQPRFSLKKYMATKKELGIARYCSGARIIAGANERLKAKKNCWKLDNRPHDIKINKTFILSGNGSCKTRNRPENNTVPAVLYQRAVLIGSSVLPSFRRKMFRSAAKKAEFIPQNIPKLNQPV
tara:strand:+ start:549 stop:935 length:387 start_codon:yes stop_codon:yes gene_type:complete